MNLDEYDLKVIEKVSKITITDYGVIKYPSLNEGYIEHDDLIVLIENLLCEIDTLQEKIDDLENDIRDNYKPISPYEMYEVSENEY